MNAAQGLPALLSGQLADLTATEARELMGAGLLSTEAYLTGLHARAVQLDGYDSLSTLLPGAAPVAKNGPLAGIPVTVKDSIDVAGTRSTAGTPALAENVVRTNAHLVDRLVEAGAVVAGKTVMHELSLGVTSHNGLHGTPKNPWDPGRIAGGSSGGSAAAVALGITPVSIGADTGGSVRVPAALCGVIGFRPTVGRYPEGGAVPLSPTRDTAGPIARSMEDIILVDAVLAGCEPAGPADPGNQVVLGISPAHLHDLDPDVRDLFDAAGRRLARNGVVFTSLDIDDLIDRARAIAFTLVWGEAGPALSRYLGERGGPSMEALVRQVSSPDVRRALAQGLGSVTPEEHRIALAEREAIQDAFSARLEAAGAAAITMPTTPAVAPFLGEEYTFEFNGRRVPTFATLIRHADLGGTIGLPGISLPIGTGPRSGLPVGLELSSPPGGDDHLLAIASTVAPIILDPAVPTRFTPTRSNPAL